MVLSFVTHWFAWASPSDALSSPIGRIDASHRADLGANAPGAVAVAWTLRNPAVTGAIVGARKPEQVDEVVAAAAIDLSQSDLKDIETVRELAA